MVKSYHWIHRDRCAISAEATPGLKAQESEMTHMPLRHASPSLPIIARPDGAPVAAAGASLVVREWTDSGPSYLHIHRSDDEAWHVLEGSLRFKLDDREIDAPAGTTVFVPAGAAHAYWTLEPTRYLIFLTPRLDALIARLRRLPDPSRLRATLADFDTVMVE
jgi:mannose-6-phosphate isomerase-like protein (cupin superfamily)